MTTSNRRFDIDWIRVIAIGLLLIYHSVIGFQPWGMMIGFITTKEPWVSLWAPMAMLNVWRIPLLFFVSGMGVYFSMQTRTWKQLLQERATRILIPFLFGIFFICPVSIAIWQYYYHWEITYNYNPGHLWFLGNIFIYVIILSPGFFYLKRNENGRLVNMLRKLFSTPLGLLPVFGAFIVEALWSNPGLYEMYAMTSHGFFLGMLAFLFGFCFVLSGDSFWKMILKWRWLFLTAAIGLYTYRLFQVQMQVPVYLLAIESNFWVISVFAWGYKFLNKPSKALDYFSQAVFPVYILHMMFLFLGSSLIFRWDIPVQWQFVLTVIFTFGGCFGLYEIIRRVSFLRPLFGLKYK